MEKIQLNELIEERLKATAEKERIAAYQKKIHSYKEITEELKRGEEECAAIISVRRPHFEVSIVDAYAIMEKIYNLMNTEKSFRMELYYDSEAQNAELNFYMPTHNETGNKNPECEG